MPLIKSASQRFIGPNINAERSAGKPYRQALAIALDVQRRARRGMADGGTFDPRWEGQYQAGPQDQDWSRFYPPESEPRGRNEPGFVDNARYQDFKRSVSPMPYGAQGALDIGELEGTPKDLAGVIGDASWFTPLGSIARGLSAFPRLSRGALSAGMLAGAGNEALGQSGQADDQAPYQTAQNFWDQPQQRPQIDQGARDRANAERQRGTAAQREIELERMRQMRAREDEQRREHERNQRIQDDLNSVERSMPPSERMSKMKDANGNPITPDVWRAMPKEMRDSVWGEISRQDSKQRELDENALSKISPAAMAAVSVLGLSVGPLLVRGIRSGQGAEVAKFLSSWDSKLAPAINDINASKAGGMSDKVFEARRAQAMGTLGEFENSFKELQARHAVENRRAVVGGALGGVEAGLFPYEYKALSNPSGAYSDLTNDPWSAARLGALGFTGGVLPKIMQSGYMPNMYRGARPMQSDVNMALGRNRPRYGGSDLVDWMLAKRKGPYGATEFAPNEKDASRWWLPPAIAAGAAGAGYLYGNRANGGRTNYAAGGGLRGPAVLGAALIAQRIMSPKKKPNSDYAHQGDQLTPVDYVKDYLPNDFAPGGNVSSPPWYTRNEARDVERYGMMHGSTPGRADMRPTGVRGGSYVVPADIVSSLGQGNSMAGASKLNQLFKMGPYGSQSGPMPHANRVPTPQIQMTAKPIRQRFAGGGEVPIKVSDGEFIIPPEKVAEIGNGNVEMGHSILDSMVKMQRQNAIRHLASLPPPRDSEGSGRADGGGEGFEHEGDDLSMPISDQDNMDDADIPQPLDRNDPMLKSTQGYGFNPSYSRRFLGMR